jgi:hypothetical protein
MHDRERESKPEVGSTQSEPVPRGLSVLDPQLPRVSAGRLLAIQRAAGNRAVTRLIQRQSVGGTGQAVGDAIRPEIDGYLTAFAAASANEEKNRLTVQAFWAAVRAYRLSTKGLTIVRFDPALTQYDGLTTGLANKDRESRVDLGPGAFGGFESFVHIVAHELEHVRQNLIGDYRDTGDDSATHSPVAEFLAYSSSILQVGPTAGTPGRHPLQELSPGPDKPPSLPALPPKLLAGEAGRALEAWQKMTDQGTPQVLAGVRGRPRQTAREARHRGARAPAAASQSRKPRIRQVAPGIPSRGRSVQPAVSGLGGGEQDALVGRQSSMEAIRRLQAEPWRGPRPTDRRRGWEHVRR